MVELGASWLFPASWRTNGAWACDPGSDLQKPRHWACFGGGAPNLFAMTHHSRRTSGGAFAFCSLNSKRTKVSAADLVLDAGASKLRLSQHAFWDDGKGEPLNQTSRITRSEDRCRGAPLGSCRAGVRDFPFSERFERGGILCLVVGALLGFLCWLVKEGCPGKGSF